MVALSQRFSSLWPPIIRVYVWSPGDQWMYYNTKFCATTYGNARIRVYVPTFDTSNLPFLASTSLE